VGSGNTFNHTEAFSVIPNAMPNSIGDADFGNFHSDLNVHSLIDPVTVDVDHRG